MQSKNRSAGATLGAAFLFLSFTAIPVSLRAVGLNVHFSPSVNAVIDVWDEIAGALQAGSQPVSTTELVALNNPNGAAPSAPDAAQPSRECQFASNRESQEPGTGVASEDHIVVAPAVANRSRTARAGRAKSSDRSVLGGRSLEMASVRVEIGELAFRPIDIAQELEGLAINREALIKEFKKRTAQVGFQMREAARLARASRDVKVLVNLGKPVERTAPGASTDKWPCPPNYTIAPKPRKVRVSQVSVPETETGEI